MLLYYEHARLKKGFITFQIIHSETIMYYQIIEHDLKLIYAYMRRGKTSNSYVEIKNKTLGQIVNILKNLDNSDGEPLISKGDYNFLSQIKDNRNLWAHSNFIKFVYKQKFLSSKVYLKQYQKLTKDHDRVEQVCEVLEKIRLEYCNMQVR